MLARQNSNLSPPEQTTTAIPSAKQLRPSQHVMQANLQDDTQMRFGPVRASNYLHLIFDKVQ
jgi:hypothetical protein